MSQKKYSKENEAKERCCKSEISIGICKDVKEEIQKKAKKSFKQVKGGIK